MVIIDGRMQDAIVWKAKYEQVHKETLDLRKALEERVSELDTAKKKHNRNIPVNGIQESPKIPTLSKQDSADIMGLKLVSCFSSLSKPHPLQQAHHSGLAKRGCSDDSAK